ncbi:uncharacterized protein PITG_06366 [Phytophthora infestans T30-4]|uniref:C2 domain-containing protein n=1 Tax=Phytophthora infestans (strain T30-4) TaxID=403677 RepID=D0N4P3_PHYIT|nr:uncharacterized protein PITG_06366 [Phytophthora infestans T30-4]EEY69851.1 conserved hypothetical protein [Phytophthora infestans T30-4]|eukprot:XP_002998498.1 conserved hypothetical protein [Phytophthora infestans T30-4]
MSYGQNTSCTLLLHVQSAQDLSTSASAAFCTTFVWNNSGPGGPTQSTSKPKYTSFSRIHKDLPVEWNEELQLDATNPQSEVLTVRVKDSSDALVGSCNVYLAHLHPGQALDQWFQLHPAGHIHLKLVLRPNQQSTPTPVPNSPYSTDYQALLEIAMKKRAATQQSQSPFPAGYPASYQQQASGHNFHEMMGTAANMSTIAANIQQLNGNNTGNSGLGTAASIGLGALGLGPFGAFFGS